MKTIKVELMDGKVNPHLASMGSGIICRHSMATLGGYIQLRKVSEKPTLEIPPNSVFGLTNQRAIKRRLSPL